jgi:hypothetical protein
MTKKLNGYCSSQNLDTKAQFRDKTFRAIVIIRISPNSSKLFFVNRRNQKKRPKKGLTINNNQLF